MPYIPFTIHDILLFLDKWFMGAKQEFTNVTYVILPSNIPAI